MLTCLALELRFDASVFWPEAPSREQVERFAHEIVPAVREAVEKEHGETDAVRTIQARPQMK